MCGSVGPRLDEVDGLIGGGTHRRRLSFWFAVCCSSLFKAVSVKTANGDDDIVPEGVEIDVSISGNAPAENDSSSFMPLF